MKRFCLILLLFATTLCRSQSPVISTFQTPFFRPIDRILTSSDGTIVIASDDAGYIFLWNTEDGSLTNILRANTGRIVALALSPDKRYIAASSGNAAVNVWDLASSGHVTKIHTPESCLALSFSSTGDALYLVISKGIYRAQKDDFTHLTKVYDAAADINAATRTDSYGVFIMREGRKLIKYDCETGKIQIIAADTGEPVSIQAGNELIAYYASPDQLTLYAWNKKGYVPAARCVISQGIATAPVIISKQHILFINGQGELRSWNAEMNSFTALGGMPDNVTAIFYDNKNLFTGDGNGLVSLCRTPAPAGNKAEKTSTGKRQQTQIPEAIAEGRPIHIREIVQVHSPVIELWMWDDENEDGDTISLSFNGKLILERYMVTKEKKKIQLTVDPEGENVLVMYAHNLGTHPPNTAAISIHDGRAERTLTLKSDLKRCDAVKLKLLP
ncbi:MAG: hypothetical protein KatS3mg031_1344 [Chitinophagales bacterium]|nr:MAG: hypothetical protein KatS3mg031_1344 [Chitinophagales bacterium]